MALNDVFFPNNVLLDMSPLVTYLKKKCGWVGGGGGGGGNQFGTKRFIQVTSKAEVTFCHLLNLLPLTQKMGRIAKLRDMKLRGIKLIIKLIMLVIKLGICTDFGWTFQDLI